jgi:hypothetical protein
MLNAWSDNDDEEEEKEEAVRVETNKKRKRIEDSDDEKEEEDEEEEKEPGDNVASVMRRNNELAVEADRNNHVAPMNWAALMRGHGPGAAAAGGSDDEDESDDDEAAAAPAVDGRLVAGEAVDVIKDVWENFDFDQENWMDIVEEYTDDPDYCYLCECDQSDREMAGNPQLRRFVQFLINNYSKMTRKKLAQQGQFVYNNDLREFAPGKKPMQCRIIIDHIERHAPTVRIQIEHQNRTVNNLIMEQATQLRLREHATKRTKLNNPHVNMYIKILETQNAVLAKLAKIRPSG